MKIPRVYDRNGREIKPGDRVRIIAEECNKFLRDCYEEDWTPDLYVAHDEIGTAIFDECYQVQVNGVMYWHLGTDDEPPEPCLEVVGQ